MSSLGFIIAFTSDFVPKLVYQLYYSQDGSLDGFVEFSLSKFKISEFRNGTQPEKPHTGNFTECYYSDHRYPPGHEHEYERTIVFWHIFAARLVFVVIFGELKFDFKHMM